MFVNRCCHGKAINITCVCVCVCVCVRARAFMHVALLIQHATCMCHIVMSFVARLAPPYFLTLSHKWHDFWKKSYGMYNLFWFSLQLLSKTFLILRRIQQDIVINVKLSLCKVPIILVGF